MSILCVGCCWFFGFLEGINYLLLLQMETNVSSPPEESIQIRSQKEYETDIK